MQLIFFFGDTLYLADLSTFKVYIFFLYIYFSIAVYLSLLGDLGYFQRPTLKLKDELMPFSVSATCSENSSGQKSVSILWWFLAQC